jgi:hypothetical protein
MEWAWSTLGAERLISLIHPERNRSVPRPEAPRARRLGDDVLAGTPVVVFGSSGRG